MIAPPAAARRSRIGRTGAVLAAAALVGSALTGCAAGKNAATAEVTGVNDANEVNVGSMALRAIAVKAPPTGSVYKKGASAELQGVFVNVGQKPDVLTSVTSGAFSGWSSQPNAKNGSAAFAGSSGTKVSIPANSRVSYGVPDATATLRVTGLKEQLIPGSAIRVTFTFQRAGSVTAELPIQLTGTPGTAVVGGTSSTPAGAGAASEPASS